MTLQIHDLSEAPERKVIPSGIVHVPRQSGWYRNYGKRALDLTLVACCVVVALPVIMLLAALVALDGHAPVYRSDRVGKNGRTFHMLKFRTMMPGPEPGITRIGRFLRATSLDELPQFWNVLRGDMSLVGPRPMRPDQRGHYTGLSYYALRPGITGLWQVSGGNPADIAQRAELDRRYERDLSLTGDLRLLLVAARAVLRGT